MQTTITFADGEQITSAKLNQIISGASFSSSDITGTTLAVVGGKLKVGTITSAEMGALSIGSGSIQSLSVTTAKIAFGAVGTLQLGNLSVGTNQLIPQSIIWEKLSTSLPASQAQMHAQTGSLLVTPDVTKHAPGAAKACGEFNIQGTGRAIKANSLNVASLTRVDSTHTTVALATNMDGVNYTVLATFDTTGGGTAENFAVSVYDKAAGSFKIMHPAEASGRAINFVVFGKYA